MEVALMKRIIMLSTLAAAMALTLALAGSASAVEPERVTNHFEGTDVLANCGGFKVLDDWVVDAQATLFFDSAGNPDYALVNVQVYDFFYNSKTGEGFADTSTFHEELDVVAPLSSHENLVTSVSGLSYSLTVPGEGVVLIDAGRLEWNEADELVFVAGQHQVLEGDTDKLCEALA